MKIVQIQFAPWDKKYNFSSNGIDLLIGDKVVVKTEMGIELGKVVGFSDEENIEISKSLSENEESIKDEKSEDKNEDNSLKIKPIIRKADVEDLEKIPSKQEKLEALEICKKKKEEYDLPMKFVGAHYSYDGSKITFAFIADGRVDFRNLVKDLTRQFGKTIRLQQIGIRDEAKLMGDVGHCGKQLCCKTHLKELVSITSDMSDIQQCSHRGSDRISGCCGRLMCCLAYEQEGYEAMSKNFPQIGDRVKFEGNKGEVISRNILKKTVNLKIYGDKDNDYAIVEVDLKKIRR